jgi:hypothetical protein
LIASTTSSLQWVLASHHSLRSLFELTATRLSALSP